MSGPLTWWANRKSQMGLKPSAKKPPHLPGKEWWTDPPTTMPQPEHIEYVAQFQREVMLRTPSHERQIMLMHCSAWLKAARRLLHEEMRSENRADLNTTDGLLIAADDAIRSAILICHKEGVTLDRRVIDVHRELQRRCTKLRRERAIESAKGVSMIKWDPTKPNGYGP